MKHTRRQFFGYGVAAWAAMHARAQDSSAEVNDVHSQLNSTRVARIVRPNNVEELQRAIADARREGLRVAISGSRHSMGGQQFGTGMLLLDMRGLNRIQSIDPATRTIDVQSGIEWPELLAGISSGDLGIIQK